jgi:glucose/arabinose dehydrogenase
MRWRSLAPRLGVVVVVVGVVLATGASSAPTAVPSGFVDEVALSGLTQPTAVRFSADGRIFVAEKSGLIKVFDGVGDTTPTTFADLRTKVHNFWDRGLLGIALDPGFPAKPYVYVLYTYDADPFDPSGAPRWGKPDVDSDGCATPPGATDDGCVVGGRLSRLQAAGDVATGPEQVLVEGWCQQYPSHSVGTLAFGPDGALYASAGDGASFTFVDYGQKGSPLNPCGDPGAPLGGVQTPPTAEGGSLRAQDLRTPADPVGLDGTVIRVDPATGAGMPDNPLASSTDANARRIVAYGLRNPFRFAVRPGTNEIWIGDVGWYDWEEIDRIANPTDKVVNFGWPCYEGPVKHYGYDAANLQICEDLYAQPGAVTPPVFSYAHTDQIVAGEACGTGSSSLAGVAFQFYAGGPYPPAYDGALFFADYSRDCIWAMLRGANGLPDPTTIQAFDAPAANPVELQVAPSGELYYADFDGGAIHRIRYFTGNRPPTAVATATPSTGTAPLEVGLDATGSSDPDGDALGYSWDLDGDGAFGDSAAARPTRTYPAGDVTVGLRVTDGRGGSATTTVLVHSANTPPTVTIAGPTAATTWKVGDTIPFAGSATDRQDGTLAPARLSWSLVLQHCPSNCHQHSIQTFPGVASGSFVAPDHDYPSYLELQLTAADSGGLSSSATVRLDPKTVELAFRSVPAGLQLVAGGVAGTTPFARTAIVGSNTTVSAGSPQTLGGSSYTFGAWSDGGAQTHIVVAPPAAATYTASYAAGATACPTGQFLAQYFTNMTLSGSAAVTRCESKVDNVWGSAAPATGVPADGFSARWSGAFDFPAGSTTFTARADDGVRLWVDGALVLDGWKDQGATSYTGTRTLTAGTHQVQVEYYENGYDAVAQVSWATAAAPPPPVTGCPAGQLRAEYFKGMTLAGTPVLTRCEPPPNYVWGAGGPGGGVPVDNFSVRWSGNVDLAAGTTTFSATADDGIRIWLDGAAILDGWKDQGATTYRTARDLAAGPHALKIEYYENAYDAVAQVSWTTAASPPAPPPCPAGQFGAQYFSNMTLAGTPGLARCELAVANDWRGGGPGNGIPSDGFSARWSAQPTFAAGSYRFTVRADDGVRLWVDGRLFVDAWKDQGATTYTATATLAAGVHDLRLEYYENGYDAVAQLSWAAV